MTDTPQDKRRVLESLLEESMVLITLDARRSGVDVPPHLRADAQLRLNLSWRFGLPMELDAWGVLATLTFRGAPYSCRVPWEAVYMIVSHATGQPFVFPADVPADLAEGLALPPPKKPELRVVAAPEAGAETSAVAEGVGPPASASPNAAADETGPAPDLQTHEAGTAPAATGDDTPEPPRTPPKRGHLRVVK